MKSFHLFDLVSQHLAVEQMLSGLTDDQKLAWLSEHGALAPIPQRPNWPSMFRFTSEVGAAATFYLDDGLFMFLGDHHFFRPAEKSGPQSPEADQTKPAPVSESQWGAPQSMIGIDADKETVVKVLGPPTAAIAIVGTTDGVFSLRWATFEKKEATWQVGMVIGGYYDSAATAEREAYARMPRLRNSR